MADAAEVLRSLRRLLIGRLTYRSRRERVGHCISTGAVFAFIMFPAAHFEWFDSSISLVLWTIFASVGLNAIGWLLWEFWGRQRFPLSPGDG